MHSLDMLKPVFAMALLTMFVALWMLFTRIPAMMRLKIDPQQGQDTGKLREHLPHEVNRVSNNYNHLFEQPTLFYALCISLAVLDYVDAFFVYAAWAFVALRFCHTLVQGLFDIVMIRFYLFIASWLVLMLMIVRACLRVFGT